MSVCGCIVWLFLVETPYQSPPSPQRFGCSTGHQGISANCGDLYGRYLDCQWIDVTDVKPGIYLLRLHVNPDYLVLESDHRNNEVTCGIELTSGFGITYYWCRLSGKRSCCTHTTQYCIAGYISLLMNFL